MDWMIEYLPAAASARISEATMRHGVLAVVVSIIGLAGGYASCGGDDTSPNGTGGGSGECSGGAAPGIAPFDSACGTCHGVEGNPAPPPCTMGMVDTTYPSVGAHQSHVGTSTWRRQIGCGECHPTPSTCPDIAEGLCGDPCVTTHEDGIVDVAWGSVAQQGTYDSLTATCSNVYCHGGTLQPDAIGSPPTSRAPQWTTVDGTQAGCAISCHTHPPGGTHDILTDCPTCHGEVISTYDELDPAAAVFADPSKHIDGIHQAIGVGGAGTGGAGG
jgi:predicted CxxxxCH...CXXCH cytochrome family protein